VGEIHLHQYEAGAHLQVLFIDPPSPIAQTSFDSTLPNQIAPLWTGDGCSVIPTGSCPTCMAPRPIDAGPVHIRGLARPVDLAFDQAMAAYEEVVTADDLLPDGTRITVDGDGLAGVVPPFSTMLAMPERAEPTSTLDSGLDAGFEASWGPSGGDVKFRVLLNITPTGGTGAPGAAIDCLADDATGHFTLPAGARALIPARPRVTQLEITRSRLVDVALGDGRGVVVHGGFSSLTGKNEP
jgi:hypothetical protein